MKRPTPARTKIAAQDIANSISTWRKLLGMTAQQLADKANVSRGTISRLEKGDPSVSFETVLGVSSALGITERLIDAFDPYETDFGRIRSEQKLPQRVRN